MTTRKHSGLLFGDEDNKLFEDTTVTKEDSKKITLEKKTTSFNLFDPDDSNNIKESLSSKKSLSLFDENVEGKYSKNLTKFITLKASNLLKKPIRTISTLNLFDEKNDDDTFFTNPIKTCTIISNILI